MALPLAWRLPTRIHLCGDSLALVIREQDCSLHVLLDNREFRHQLIPLNVRDSIETKHLTFEQVRIPGYHHERVADVVAQLLERRQRGVF